MARYIDREKLPQFQLYKSYAGGDENGLSWNMDFSDSTQCYVKDNTYTNDANIYKNPDKIDLNSILYMWHRIKTGQELPVPITDFVRTSTVDFAFKLATGLTAMMKDEKYSSVWKDHMEKLAKSKKYGDPDTYSEFLLTLYNGLRMMQYVQLAQGCPINVPGPTVDSSKTEYPKLLLVESDLYRKCKDTDNLHIDYGFLKSVLDAETPVIVINGDSSEKKMFFVIERRNDAPDWDSISVCRIDPMNGISQFSVMPESDSASGIITGQPYLCHPKGDYDCKRCEEIRTQLISQHNIDKNAPIPCYYGKDNNTCPNRIMKSIAAVIYCYIEYKKKALNKKITDTTQKYTYTREKDRTQPFVPSNMIKMYDIKMTDEEKVRFDKFARYNKNGSSHASFEMSPHVRRGCYRYNPKTGQKDIKVRGCIVHKDRYEGFVSADRIVG